MVRKIIHIDMDAFFASVEVRDDPSLVGRPVVVGGRPDSRGVVAAASYEARRYGIHSAMPCAMAYRLCPEAVFLRPNFERYREVSRAIREMFFAVTELVEPLSLDEAYLDVTRNRLDEPLAGKIALHLKRRIQRELGLTASAGVGPNKFIAKVASDYQKPDGLTIIPPERVEGFVAALDVEKMWSVGPVTAARLHALNIYKGADLRRRSLVELTNLLGKQGAFLHALARGHDPRLVTTAREPRTRGTERTFGEDVLDIDVLSNALEAMCEGLIAELGRLGREARTVTVKVRYSDFTTATRSHTLVNPIEGSEQMFRVALDLLRWRTEATRRPLRLLGVRVSNFTDPTEPWQLSFGFE